MPAEPAAQPANEAEDPDLFCPCGILANPTDIVGALHRGRPVFPICPPEIGLHLAASDDPNQCFYEPDAGRILVDGIDLQRLDPEAWRRRLTAGFQDHARLELLARESVGTGDLRRIDDDGFIRGAVARAGASSVIDSLPAGLQTQLGGTWEGGPLLQILDEPTSSLDPRAENELFERLAKAARRDWGQSQITILVSHRFSTVRVADVIVVLDRGRVREVGSHREPMARGELYAELYTIQAASCC